MHVGQGPSGGASTLCANSGLLLQSNPSAEMAQNRHHDASTWLEELRPEVRHASNTPRVKAMYSGPKYTSRRIVGIRSKKLEK